MSSFDGRELRRILGHYPTGVCVVTTVEGDEPVGMVVGSFTSVSLDPPLVGFLPDRRSTTWPRIERAGRFCVNVLAERQEGVCSRLARRCEDRFEGVPFTLSGTGLPVLDGVVAWIECDLHAVHEAGDHFFVLGLIKSLDVERSVSPLVFLRGGYGGFLPSVESGQGARETA